MQPAELQSPWSRLERTIVQGGLCTHCGLCEGWIGGVEMRETERGPLPQKVGPIDDKSAQAVWACCPARGVPFPELSTHLGRFDRARETPLLGAIDRLWVGHASNDRDRRRGASGGVITTTLKYLLQTSRIDGAVVLTQGAIQAKAEIATTSTAIEAAAQSVYAATPLLDIWQKIEAFPGRLAIVGLPDQIAAIRLLQAAGSKAAAKIQYAIGPYVGTILYAGAIRAFLRGQGVRDHEKIRDLKWREGEWPGYLQVRLEDGRVFRSKKFYYNYLIPFYITDSCQLTPDFSNELTDLSVGDAWSPVYEKQGQGFSVVLSRKNEMSEILNEMRERNVITLNSISVDEALKMHGHMLDFKKRGTFIRIGWRKSAGLPTPDFGYRPDHVPTGRVWVERFLQLLFWLGKLEWVRRIVLRTPQSLLGPAFDVLRKSWKDFSKPVKRKGLAETRFQALANQQRWQEILNCMRSENA